MRIALSGLVGLGAYDHPVSCSTYGTCPYVNPETLPDQVLRRLIDSVFPATQDRALYYYLAAIGDPNGDYDKIYLQGVRKGLCQSQLGPLDVYLAGGTGIIVDPSAHLPQESVNQYFANLSPCWQDTATKYYAAMRQAGFVTEQDFDAKAQQVFSSDFYRRQIPPPDRPIYSNTAVIPASGDVSNPQPNSCSIYWYPGTPTPDCSNFGSSVPSSNQVSAQQLNAVVPSVPAPVAGAQAVPQPTQSQLSLPLVTPQPTQSQIATVASNPAAVTVMPLPSTGSGAGTTSGFFGLSTPVLLVGAAAVALVLWLGSRR